LQGYLSEHAWGRVLLEHAPKAAQSLTESGQALPVTGLFSGLMSFLEAVIVILVVGIFGAAEPAVYRHGLLHLVPPRHRPRVSDSPPVRVFTEARAGVTMPSDPSSRRLAPRPRRLAGGSAVGVNGRSRPASSRLDPHLTNVGRTPRAARTWRRPPRIS